MSTANYVIICAAKGSVLAANPHRPEERIAAAMNGAASLVGFVELRYASHTLPTEAPAIIEQISRTQHTMMEMLQTGGVKTAQADEIITTMFQQMDQLEDALE